MKILLMMFLLAISNATFAGPRVTGNGGGGVKVNGVYKTFYSAGIYINPEAEESIPSAELYTKTILSLAGQKESLSKLLSAALPAGDRKFYRILEDKMEEKTMDRLIEEYARVVNQPKESLILFAITDIGTKTTYLLPSFYNLSEVEQSAILFHEAYWILNPQANYEEVISAEIAFQRFVELSEEGKFDLKLPQLLGNILKDNSLSLLSAYKTDIEEGNLKGLVDNEGGISIRNLFLGNDSLCSLKKYETAVGTEIISGNVKFKDKIHATCTLSQLNIPEVYVVAKKHPTSLYFKELINFLGRNNKILFDRSGIEINEKDNFKKEKISITEFTIDGSQISIK